MRNIHHILLYTTLGVILVINLQQWNLWEKTVPRYNLDNSTVPDSGRDMWNAFLENPFLPVGANAPWGEMGQLVFRIIFMSLAAVAVLWVLQGGRSLVSHYYGGGVTLYNMQFHNRLRGMKPIDCSLQTLIWILVTVPVAITFAATGASLNYYWDFQNWVPYYPFHFISHFLFAYSIVSIWACFDIEETFNCRYRWKALLLMGAIQIFSFYLENTENLMILRDGLHAWMYNSIADSRFDMLAVILGGWVALTLYNGWQYRS
jgi:hypothetical protein